MSDCIFCQIVAGKIPANKVYENDDLIAFLDIMPVNKGHVLVVPKQHYKKLTDLSDESAGKLITAVKKIVPAILSGVGAEDYNLTLNQGKLAGQAVDHLHWHIMPRFEGDGYQLWTGKSYMEGEAEKITEAIKNSL